MRPQTEIDTLSMLAKRGDGLVPRRLIPAANRLIREGLIDVGDCGACTTNAKGRAVLVEAGVDLTRIPEHLRAWRPEAEPTREGER